ncbi:MAG: glycosyltransferase family 2 protein [Bacillota bacterium]
MMPAFISYVTFNRMGLTVRNLNSLLKTTDDFELNIIDSNSKDDTWDFIQSLSDSRIKSITRLPENKGPIYALNYNLAKRKPGQYFITLDSDVHIYTPDWISRFMKVFDTFPDVGLLGVTRPKPYLPYIPPVKPIKKDGVSYLQLSNSFIGVPSGFVHGYCQCLRPELIDMIGYWSEECGAGDAELSIRVNRYTPFKAGFVTDIKIDMYQSITCEKCEGQKWCKLDRSNNTCFNIHTAKHKNKEFVLWNFWKYFLFFNEIEIGKRSAYCASIHDADSIKNHKYNHKWAQENFDFYARNSN